MQYHRATRFITLIFSSLGTLALMWILGAMFYNILARAMFNVSHGALNWQLKGLRDAVQHGLIVLVFSSLPFLPQQGLIQVGFLADKMPELLANFLAKTWIFLLALIAGLALIQFFLRGLGQLESGETSQDLTIPAYILSFYICLCLSGLMISCSIKFFAMPVLRASKI